MSDRITTTLSSVGATWDHDSWRHEAGCRTTDTAVFFPEGTAEQVAEATELATAICAACPVREQCLEFALRTRQLDGIWGGLGEEQRRSLRRRRLAAARRDAAASARRLAS